MTAFNGIPALQQNIGGLGAVRNVSPPGGELMSAESSLTAVAVVRALLNEDTEGLAVLLPDGLPEPAASSWPAWPA